MYLRIRSYEPILSTWYIIYLLLSSYHFLVYPGISASLSFWKLIFLLRGLLERDSPYFYLLLKILILSPVNDALTLSKSICFCTALLFRSFDSYFLSFMAFDILPFVFVYFPFGVMNPGFLSFSSTTIWLNTFGTSIVENIFFLVLYEDLTFDSLEFVLYWGFFYGVFNWDGLSCYNSSVIIFLLLYTPLKYSSFSLPSSI